jgi:hypothetical protein
MNFCAKSMTCNQSRGLVVDKKGVLPDPPSTEGRNPSGRLARERRASNMPHLAKYRPGGKPATNPANCPKCRRPMVTRSHPPDWKPRPGQPYYFSSWDYCRPCGHTQHYEARKVYIDAPVIEPEEFARIGANTFPVERVDDDAILSALDEMKRAELVAAARLIPAKFTGNTKKYTVPPWEEEPAEVASPDVST